MSDSDDDDIFGGGSDGDALSDVEPKQRGGRARKTVKYDFDSDFSDWFFGLIKLELLGPSQVSF